MRECGRWVRRLNRNDQFSLVHRDPVMSDDEILRGIRVKIGDPGRGSAGNQDLDPPSTGRFYEAGAVRRKSGCIHRFWKTRRETRENPAGIPDVRQPRFIRNTSGRFESRWATVKIIESPAVMLRGMEGSTFGIWVDHGEGRLHCPDPDILRNAEAKQLTPILFVDDEGCPTERYPLNPNGSPGGITALCSPDGRHLAMMPHPERSFLKWQWPWMPQEWKQTLKASPWLRMFQNARAWCDGG